MTQGNKEGRELPEGWCWVQHKNIAEINPRLPFNNLQVDGEYQLQIGRDTLLDQKLTSPASSSTRRSHNIPASLIRW